jgi:hypothetical protein
MNGVLQIFITYACMLSESIPSIEFFGYQHAKSDMRKKFHRTHLIMKYNGDKGR